MTDWCRVCRKTNPSSHDDVIKWKHFSRYWSFVWRIHRSPVNSPHKGQWRGVVFSLICAWINGWVNNREAGDLRRQRAHCDVNVMDSVNLYNKAGYDDISWCLYIPSSWFSLDQQQSQTPQIQQTVVEKVEINWLFNFVSPKLAFVSMDNWIA